MSDTPTSGFTEDTALLLFDYLFKKRTPEQLDKAVASIKAGGFPIPTDTLIRTLTYYITDSLVIREMAVWALAQAAERVVLQAMEPYGGTVSGRWESDGKNVESLDKPKRLAYPLPVMEAARISMFSNSQMEVPNGTVLSEGSGSEETGEGSFDVGGES